MSNKEAIKEIVDIIPKYLIKYITIIEMLLEMAYMKGKLDEIVGEDDEV